MPCRADLVDSFVERYVVGRRECRELFDVLTGRSTQIFGEDVSGLMPENLHALLEAGATDEAVSSLFPFMFIVGMLASADTHPCSAAVRNAKRRFYAVHDELCP